MSLIKTSKPIKNLQLARTTFEHRFLSFFINGKRQKFINIAPMPKIPKQIVTRNDRIYFKIYPIILSIFPNSELNKLVFPSKKSTNEGNSSSFFSKVFSNSHFILPESFEIVQATESLSA